VNINFAGDEDEGRRAWSDFEDLCSAVGREAQDIIPAGTLTIACSLVQGLEVPCAKGIRPVREESDERFRIQRWDTDSLAISAATATGAYRALCSFFAPRAASAPTQHDDGPAYSYRSLNLDVARYRASERTIERVIDLLAVHRMSALHLHLTDHQSWRIPVKGFDRIGMLADVFTPLQLNQLKAHAAKRHICLIPEIDLPGHCAALLSVYPQLAQQKFANPILSYISPDAPQADAFFDSCTDALCELATGEYVHIGGDEVFGMAQEAYDRAITALIEDVHRRGGKAMAWQEASRAHARADAYQYWMTQDDIASEEELAASWPASFKPYAHAAAAMYAQCREDPRRMRDKGAYVVDSRQSFMYLDRKYAERSRDQAQNERMETLGFPNYEPQDSMRVLEGHSLERAEGIVTSGVEGALWTETVREDADIATLLLPRLALIADLAWRGRAEDRGSEAPADVCDYADFWAKLGFGDYYQSTTLFH
jgi:hexosaminidase